MMRGCSASNTKLQEHYLADIEIDSPRTQEQYVSYLADKDNKDFSLNLFV